VDPLSSKYGAGAHGCRHTAKGNKAKKKSRQRDTKAHGKK
jgi:hypothetical protein